MIPAGETIDKFRDAYKNIDTFGDLCRVASAGSLIDKILGTVRASAATVCQRLLSLINISNNYNSTAVVEILEGAVKNGSAQGFHHTSSSVGRKVGANLNSRILSNGDTVYEAVVDVKDVSGNWIRKTANNQKSSFFPDNWSEQQVIDAVNEAYSLSKAKNIGYVSGNTYRATTQSGMTIDMFIDANNKIISAFPQLFP